MVESERRNTSYHEKMHTMKSDDVRSITPEHFAKAIRRIEEFPRRIEASDSRKHDETVEEVTVGGENEVILPSSKGASPVRITRRQHGFRVQTVVVQRVPN